MIRGLRYYARVCIIWHRRIVTCDNDHSSDFWVYLEEFGVFWGILSIFFRVYWYSTTPPGRPWSVCRKSCYTYTPDLEKISSCALFSNLHKRCQKLGMGNRKCEMILKMPLYLAQEAWNGPREDSLACLVTRSAHLNRKNKLKKYSWLWSIKVVAGSYNC